MIGNDFQNARTDTAQGLRQCVFTTQLRLKQSYAETALDCIGESPYPFMGISYPDQRLKNGFLLGAHLFSGYATFGMISKDGYDLCKSLAEKPVAPVV